MTLDEVLCILARFDRPKKVHDTASHLVRSGLIKKVGLNMWALTGAGENALFDMAGRPVRKVNGRVEKYSV